MSWIKDNQFIVVLSGITLVGAAALIFVGLQGSSRFNAASESYQEASGAANTSESLPLYPAATNRQGKTKALTEYRSSVMDLQNAFAKYRPEAIKNIAPQEFTNRLKEAHAEVVTAFEGNKATVPQPFFLGFENYTGNLARESATGILDYELGAVKELMLALAKSRPSQLINFHRPRLSEEEGTEWKPTATDVARALPVEVTFKGSEDSARAFLSSIAKSDKYYYVIRSVRIGNEKKTPPLAADGKFDPIAPASSEAAPASSGFALPPDPSAPAAPEGQAAAPAAAEAAPAPAAAAPVDSGRILSQVLGGEEIQVFLRIDILQFLPVKELPQP